MAKEKKMLAYQKASAFEDTYGVCSQATLIALMEVFDEVNERFFQSVSAYAGGCASEGDGICGAYAAALFFLSTKFGRKLDDLDKDPEDPGASKKQDALYDKVEIIHEHFIQNYGSVICHNIHRKIFGRPFYTKDEDEKQKFDAANAKGIGCKDVCGDTARKIIEILEEA